MSAAVILVTFTLGRWRLAIDAETLTRIDRENRVLYLRDGVRAPVDSIEPAWDCAATSVLALPLASPGVKGWVACGNEIFLLVESSFFLLERPSEPPPSPAPQQFLSHLFGRLLVFGTLATQGLLCAALSIKQAMEIVPATALTPFEDDRTQMRQVLFWRGQPVPVADWPLFLIRKPWHPSESSHFLLARSLKQRLLVLPVQAPIQTEPADSAAVHDPTRSTHGVLGWYTMQSGPVAVLDLDAILDC